MLKRYKKGIVLLFLVTFVQEIVAPTVSLALTGGPSQPEVQSFEPVGTNQMVDLSTGDFNYNIPLMVVPGPNGGYPINIAYHAGITMEQEASWVGLGWNINPGAITRNLRGIPDDFNGDIIKKSVSIKKDITVGVGMNLEVFTQSYGEVFGQPLPPSIGQLEIYFNNYRGVGYEISLSRLSNKERKVGGKDNGGILGAIGLTYNSQTGLGLTINRGVGHYVESRDRIWNIGVGFHSRQGMQSFSFSKNRLNGRSAFNISKRGSNWKGITFVNHTYVPGMNKSMVGTNVDSRLTIAKKQWWGDMKKANQVYVSVNTNRIKDVQRNLEAYGALHLQNQGNYARGTESYDQMMDMNVSNDVPITKHSVNMGFPMLTNDIYLISGQGIGGTFRAHRTDLGKMFKPGNTSKINNITAGVELGLGNLSGFLLHVGADPGYGYSNSYSGKWSNGHLQTSQSIGFNEAISMTPLYEPYYFKVIGEQVAMDQDEFSYQLYEKPVSFDIGLQQEGISPKPFAKNHLPGSSQAIKSKGHDKPRVKRAENVGYSTKEEITKDENYSNRAKYIYPENSIPNNSNGNTIDYGSMGDNSHIQEFKILKPDGTSYTYGLPAYNNVQKEKMFSNINSTITEYTDADNTTYNAADATTNNDEGYDHYYSETEIPPYVHSNLITNITSADYVDLTNNGPSEDDFGFYTKFNYSKVSDYKWRSPYENSNFIKGYYSNTQDDKAAYTYGEKDLYYVHTIETKTHIAKFALGDRNDGLGVDNADQTSTSPKGIKQKYIKTISLYSKADPLYGTSQAVPLQVVHFEYNYELCRNVPNNDNGIDDPNHIKGFNGAAANEGGKLTLKKIYITYNGNEKGRLSPYEFKYNKGNNIIMRNYNKNTLDRWGNYQLGTTVDDFMQSPYTRQDISELESNDNAGTWNLSQVKMPSGALLNVDYEMDDYGYVQDKRAMQMFEIYGFSKTDSEVIPTGDDKFRLSKKNRRLWFKLNNSLSPGASNVSENQAIIADHINGVSEIYFKSYQLLKRKPLGSNSSDKAKDYVTGYAKIISSNYGYDENDLNYAYVDLEEVKYQTSGFHILKTHPFRKAGWQYIRYQRPDLFQNLEEVDGIANAAIVSIVSTLGNIISETISLVALGYYNKAAILGYSKEFSSQKKSFVRLNSPNHRKKGGGHRVKSLKLLDNWVEGAREFGTEYQYLTESGETSGVADYEPLLGGEENCLKNPIWYNGSQQTFSFRHIDAYVETPIAEAVYPGAKVLYSRVIEKNIDEQQGLVTEAQSGITVHEFFTAKDFPVYEKQSKLTSKGFNLPLVIPFVGLQTFQNNGYSQGYTVVLNDMSGRPRSVSSYKYTTAADLGEPINKTEYIYKTSSSKRLDNKVKVLDAHGVQRNAVMGVEQDLAINEEENSTKTMTAEAEVNLDLWMLQLPLVPPIPLPFPSGKASFNYSESMYRGISTSKTIYKTGILEKVRVFSEGSSVTTENLLFDAETGEPLLTKVINEWDKPVYSYSYPAHWAYPGMKGAYRNHNAKLTVQGGQGALELVTGNLLTVISPEDILTLGDEILIFDNSASLYRTYYVTEIDNLNDEFTLEDAGGNSIGFSTPVSGRIKRSGYRNLQSVKSGSIISLNQSFMGSGTLPGSTFSLFSTSFNNYITGNTDPPIVHNQNYFTAPHVSYFQFNIPDLTGSNVNNEPRFSIRSQLGANTFLVNVINGGCLGHYLINIGYDLPFSQRPEALGYLIDIYPNPPSYGHTAIGKLVDFEIISDLPSTLGRDLVMLHIPSGTEFNATLHYSEVSCETETPSIYTGVLHSDATTFSDDWGNTYPYSDLGDPTIGTVPLSNNSINEYRYGKKGIWRTDKNYVFQKERLQSNLNANANTEFETRIDIDGEYAFWKPFEWTESATNPDWDWVSEITKYSPYGFVLEEKSRLSADPSSGNSVDVFTSQITGYDNSLVTAKSSNTAYYEFGYNGFEEDVSYSNRGHINLTSTASLTHSASKAHTGKQSLNLQGGQNINFSMNANNGTNLQLYGLNSKEYIVSLWVNVEDPGSKLTISVGANTIDTDSYGETIDGWKKIELKFTMGQVNKIINMVSTGNTFIDDIRISPYSGGMVSYVYDRYNLWLTAELDALNYATFYNYDSEGNLVQVKKETEKGIVTLKTSRSNNKQIP